MRLTRIPIMVFGAIATLAVVGISSGAVKPLIHVIDSPSPQAGARFGQALAAGDANGDGRADLFVDAGSEDVVANLDQGRAYLFSGGTGALLLTVDTPNPQAGTLTFGGEGLSMGDVDGDGKADLLIGARSEDVGTNIDQGRAYVLSGVTGALLRTLNSPNPQGGANFGEPPSMGDVDGDGKADLLVGARNEDVANEDQGRAYLFNGADGMLLRTLDSPNSQAFGRFGESLAMGDTGGDGDADLLVGADVEDVGANVREGRAYLFSGVSPYELLHTFNLPTPQEGAEFGDSLAMGDTNGDLRADVLIGAPLEDVAFQDQGRAYLFSGVPPYGLLHTFDIPSPQADAKFGDNVAVGDFDGDGLADIAVGVQFEDILGNVDQGRVYVFSGDANAVPPYRLLATLDTPNPQAGAKFGNSIAIGDFDGDGVSDVAVSAQFEDVLGNVDQGRVYAFCFNPVEADGDTFTDCEERWVGTDETLPCSTDRWPADFDNNHLINIIDVLALKPSFGSKYDDASYDRRTDLNADGVINIVDVLRFKPIFNTSCIP